MLSQRNMLSIDVFKLMQLKASVKYERVFPRKSGTGIMATVYFYNSLNMYRPVFVWEEGRYGGFKLEPFYSFYFKGYAPKGTFLRPRLHFGYFNSDIEYRHYTAENMFDYLIEPTGFFSAGAGITFGNQWLIEDKFPLEVSFGIQYAYMFADRFKKVKGINYERNDNTYLPGTASWYVAGPGAIFEIGLKFGYLFR